MTSTSAAPFGPAPNLTEHFKQALNMTRNQFQSGSSPLGASTQMGISTPQFSNFGTPQNGAASAALGSGVPGSTPVGIDGNFEMSPALLHHQPSIAPAGGLVNWIKSNSTWIIILSSIVIVGLGLYFFWWKNRKLPEHFTQGQISSQRQMDPIHQRQPFMQQQVRQHELQPTYMNEYSETNQRFNPRPLNQQRQQPQQSPQFMSSMDEKPENIRGNEQQMSQRGAEFANPSFVSQMMPVSTRISSPQSQPQSSQTSVPPPQPQSQPSQQQIQLPISQPQIQIPIPISQPTQPQIQIPISQPTQQQIQIPVSQPTQQQIQIPVSQPTQSIPPPPIVPVSDPNFTAI